MAFDLSKYVRVHSCVDFTPLFDIMKTELKKFDLKFVLITPAINKLPGKHHEKMVKMLKT